MPGESPLVLRLAGIGKRFGALAANEAIDLELRRGEILALLGENGAGKTTLMNILFGHYVADEGSISVAGPDGTLAPLRPGSPQAALDAGVGMVHQHFALAESLTVLENVVLGTRPLGSLRLDLAGARKKLVALMADSGLDVAPDRRVSRLSVGEKQRLEILKVLYRGARILVLDEPTAVLTPAGGRGLFVVLRRLVANGLSVIFISHKMNEVLAIADRIAVLRAGRKVADRPAAGASRANLAELMVGREVAQSRRTPRPPGAALLVLDRVTVTDPHGRAGLAAASLTVHAGEIVGIAGVSGNGQGALAGVIAGTMAGQGTITLEGVPLHAEPARVDRGRRRTHSGGPSPRGHRRRAVDRREPRARNVARRASRAWRLPEVRRVARARRSGDPPTTTCAARARTRRSGSCPAAISRRSSSRACSTATRAWCWRTSRPAGSTSARPPRSTAACWKRASAASPSC